MKRSFVCIAVMTAVLVCVCSACGLQKQNDPDDSAVLDIDYDFWSNEYAENMQNIKAGNIRYGNRDEMDSLSYYFGMSMGYEIKYSSMDLPLDINVVSGAAGEAMLGTASQGYGESVEYIKNYFNTKYYERRNAVLVKHAKDDSVRLAQGDTTTVRYKADPTMFDDDNERHDFSYALGNNYGSSIRSDVNLTISAYWFSKGLVDAFENNDALMGSDVPSAFAVNAYMQNYLKNVRPGELKEQSERWLADAERQEGVQKSSSGLLYKIEQPGDMNVRATDDRDTVIVRYAGICSNGYEFESTYAKVENLKSEMERVRNDASMPERRKEYELKRLSTTLELYEQVDYVLNDVIKGWTEGLKYVGKGGKITLWMPAKLAYGESGAGNTPTPYNGVGPNQALRFDIELLDVKPYMSPAFR